MGKATHVLSIYCIIKNKTNLIVLYSYIYLYIYTVQRFPYHHKFIVTRLTCTVYSQPALPYQAQRQHITQRCGLREELFLLSQLSCSLVRIIIVLLNCSMLFTELIN